MSVTLVEVTKNTRGKNSREIKFNAIGKYVTRTIDRETDEEGNDLGKDAEGKQITRPEVVKELESDGVVTSLEDALELVGGNQQKMLDCFAIGFNQEAYREIADKDELDEFVSSVPEEKRDALKRAIRAVAKAMSLELSVAAEAVMAMQSND